MSFAGAEYVACDDLAGLGPAATGHPEGVAVGGVQDLSGHFDLAQLVGHESLITSQSLETSMPVSSSSPQ
jgi:hypothetical protein